MVSHEQRLVITNVFRRLGLAFAIGAAWMIGLNVLAAIIDLMIKHRLDSFLVDLQGIPGMLLPIFNMILVGYFLITAYQDFKWTIQNGISRRTLWWGRFVALILATCGIWLIDELLSLFDHPLAGWKSMGLQFLLLLTGTLVAQMIGNGFGLLNRTWKWIVGIGLPILAGLLLFMLIRIAVSLNLSFQHALWEIANSSVTWWIAWGIGIIVVIFLSKFFNDRLQLRRD